MKKKTIMIALVMTILQIILLDRLNAQDSWEINIKARLLNAENKLTIGQRPDATDSIDGRYDIPALLAGDIKAYIELEGDKYWKDIRQSCKIPCKKTWNIIVESEIQGELIELSWDLESIPHDTRVILIDTETGEVIDMDSEHKYTYKNTGPRGFILEAQRW
jgi:hypothetical protein